MRRLIHTWRAAVGPAPVLAGEPLITPRQFTGWLMRPRHKLTPDEYAELHRVLDRCQTLHELDHHVTGFVDMLRHRRGHLLDTWIGQARASSIPQLRSFADGMVRDYDAVRNGLTLPQSSGAVEGTVTKIKQRKRAAYGRANFDLLRHLVLAR